MRQVFISSVTYGNFSGQGFHVTADLNVIVRGDDLSRGFVSCPGIASVPPHTILTVFA
jgi:hypothetical protein